jgi:hypothetical protein
MLRMMMVVTGLTFSIAVAQVPAKVGSQRATFAMY